MPRLVGGSLRGRVLAVPDGKVARPTADRVRENLFNILAHGGWTDLPQARVIDVFAGSGALGIEALSRGAATALFVENHPASLKALSDNIRSLGLQDSAQILRTDATRLPPASTAPDRAGCTLAFLDAPYDRALSLPALTALDQGGWLAPDALVVVEVAAKESLIPPASFEPLDQRSYGAARLVFCRYHRP